MENWRQTRLNQISDWLLQAENSYVRLRRELAQTGLASERSEVRQSVAALSENIQNYEAEWVALQAPKPPANLYLQLARLHYDGGNFDLALASYDQVLDQAADKPVKSEALLERGDTKLQLARWFDALLDYGSIDEADNTYYNLRTAIGRGIACYHLKEWQETRLNFEEAERLAILKEDESNQAVALSYLAAVAYQTGDINAAIELYRRAAASGEKGLDNKNLANLYTNLGDLERRSGQNQNAEDSYQKALALEPSNPEALEGLGLLARPKGNINEEETYLRKALEFDPDRPNFAVNLANLRMRQRRIEEAQALYLKAYQNGWEQSSLFNGLGMCAIALGNLAEAENYFRRAVELNPESFTGWGNLGAVRLYLDRFEEAEKAYAQAVQTGKAGAVEAAWNAILSGQQESEVENALANVKVSQDNYELAEYEAAQFLPYISQGKPELALREAEQRLVQETDPLNRFYWQNLLQLANVLAPAGMESAEEAIEPGE